MSLIKCIECGNMVSDKAEVCPKCGAPVSLSIEANAKEKAEKIVEEEQKPENGVNESAQKKSHTKGIIAFVALVLIVAGGIFAYMKVTEDKEPPVFDGIKEKQVVEIKCGTTFNLNDYVKENLSITDNKDGEIKEYTINSDEKVYNSETGEISTSVKGTFPVTITVQDKAKNESKLAFDLKLKPIRIKEAKQYTVYKGDLGIVKLTSFKHGYIDGVDQYNVKFEFENKSDTTMEIYLSSADTYINDVGVDAYYTMYNSVNSGKKGDADCSIYDRDIPKKVGKFKVIETELVISDYDRDEAMLRIPIDLYTSALK